jgi:uncharacterized protein YndB with AHSA1/START domain
VIRYSSEVSIARAPHDVFAALLDPERYAQWTPMTDMVFEGSGPPRIGQRGSFRLAEGPIKGRLEMEIVELDTDRRIVFRVTHPALDWKAVNTIQPDGAGSRLTYAGEMSLRGWRRLLEPVMGGEIRNGEAKEALRLKELLEAEPTAASDAAATSTATA